MIGSQELILILAVLLIVFGPKNLPKLAKELGRAIQYFRRVSVGIADVVNSELKYEDEVGDMIVMIARNLGINTKGKSTTLLLEEIGEKG